MFSKLWRVSHLALALASLIFLFIASITGAILSTEPLQQKISTPSNSVAVDTTSLATIIPLLQDNYIEVFSLEVDENKGVKVSVIGMDEEADGDFFIDPATGEKNGEIEKQSTFYAWNTALHRSLFLHKTGRVIMGVTSLLLLLLTVSGFALILKRTQGFKNIFKKIEKQKNASYYHTILGRFLFIPIALISLSGAYMFIGTMSSNENPEEISYEVTEQESIEASEFPIFVDTKLKDILSIDFPFSMEEEDYFIINFPDKKINVHQFTGQIITLQEVSSFNQWQEIAKTIHTGKGHFPLALFFGLVSLNLLYFIYSGVKITWQRIGAKSSNKVKAEEAEIIILVGSENGSSQRFATLLFKALLNNKYSVFMSDLNHYQTYPKAKHLVILTSTYGDGEAPFNARNFIKKTKEVKQSSPLKTHLIGFGSMSYPKFCQFALDVETALSTHKDFILSSSPTLIHGQSFTNFQLSIEEWKKKEGLHFELSEKENKKTWPEANFKIIKKNVIDDSYTLTFTLEIEPLQPIKYQAGDLLAITPFEENTPRFYSIGTNKKGNIILSVRKHEFGVCSTYLFHLEEGETLLAQVKENTSFHLPKRKEVLMIANGTGIAPFLGMARLHPKQPKTLFYGGRTKKGYGLYQAEIEEDLQNNFLDQIHFAFSKEEHDAQYVQELVIRYQDEIIRLLRNKGVIMICGSIKMRDGVLAVLKEITIQQKAGELESYIKNNQILMDCY